LDLSSILITFAIVIVSLSVHEAAHAWTAYRLGDPTARDLGRMTLNPTVHIDPIGTVLLPLVAAYSGLPIIGWAKPVPVNIYRLAHPRRDFMFVAAAGPISNILQACVASLLLRTLIGGDGGPIGGSMLIDVLFEAMQINVLLAVFNLVPVPPLDGGNVLAGLLPEQGARMLDRLRPFGFILLYGLMLSGILTTLIIPPARFILGVLVP
jgi:Zn-dependent protease